MGPKHGSFATSFTRVKPASNEAAPSSSLSSPSSPPSVGVGTPPPLSPPAPPPLPLPLAAGARDTGVTPYAAASSSSRSSRASADDVRWRFVNGSPMAGASLVAASTSL